MEKKTADDEDLTPVLIPKAAPLPPSSSAASALGGATEKRAAEDWALAKGMLPLVPRGAPSGSGINRDYWKFAGAKAFKGWQEGALITEEEFDAAVAGQLSASHR